MPTLHPDTLTYVLDFYGKKPSMPESQVRECGGFVACVALPGFESMRVIDRVTEEQVARVVVRDGMRPIFARLVNRNLTGRVVGPGIAEYEPVGDPLIRAVVYGWQQTVQGRNVQMLVWVTREEVFVSDRQLDEIERT